MGISSIMIFIIYCEWEYHLLWSQLTSDHYGNIIISSIMIFIIYCEWEYHLLWSQLTSDHYGNIIISSIMIFIIYCEWEYHLLWSQLTSDHCETIIISSIMIFIIYCEWEYHLLWSQLTSDHYGNIIISSIMIFIIYCEWEYHLLWSQLTSDHYGNIIMGWWSRCQDGAIRSLWWGTGGAADLDSTSPAKNSLIDNYRAWYYLDFWRWLFCDYNHLSSILTKNSGFSMAFLYYVNIREIYPPTVAFQRWDSHRFIASQADWEAKKLFVNTVRAQTSAPEVILLVSDDHQQFWSTDDHWWNHQFVKKVFPLLNHPQFPSKLEDGWKVDYVDVQIQLPSGKQPHSYGKSLFLMGKSTISMAIFNSYFDITRGYIPWNPIKSY